MDTEELRVRLLDIASEIKRDCVTFERVSRILENGWRTGKHTQDEKIELHNEIRRLGRMCFLQANELQGLASAAPSAARALLYDAATDLVNGVAVHEVPNKITKALAAFSDAAGSAAPPTPGQSLTGQSDSPPDKNKKLPRGERTRQAIQYVNRYRRRVKDGKARHMPLRDLLAEFADCSDPKEIAKLERALAPSRHGHFLVPENLPE